MQKTTLLSFALSAVLLFSILNIFFEPAHALIPGLGADRHLTARYDNQLVCGEELCKKPMTTDEKIGLYILKYLAKKDSKIFQQSRFAVSGISQQTFDLNAHTKSPQDRSKIMVPALNSSLKSDNSSYEGLRQNPATDESRLFDFALAALKKAGTNINSYLAEIFHDR